MAGTSTSYQIARQKKVPRWLALLALASLLAGCAAPVATADLPRGTGTLEVTVGGLRNIRGELYLSLFAGPDGFPDDTEQAVANRRIPLQQRTVTVVLDDLPYGEYALSLLHDENSDGRMNTTLLGIPREGYGFSNDAEGSFGPPGYADARFLHLSPDTRLHLQIRYVEPKRRGPGS